jgi:FMN phosphatase YigB (HAD superfamily)
MPAAAIIFLRPGKSQPQPRTEAGIVSPVEVVFIDWHKTLSTSRFWQPGPGCRLGAEELASAARYVFSRPGLVRQWMAGAAAADDVCAVAAAGLGLQRRDLLADLEHSCRRMEFYDPSVVQALRLLRRRSVAVVLATDNMDTFRRWTVPALGLHGLFDSILDSATIGALKDDLTGGRSPFFGPWLGQRGIASSAALLLDDSRMPAAEAIGLTTCLVDHPGRLATMLAGLARERWTLL